MASPHATGVAALIVSEYGKEGRRRRPHAGPDARPSGSCSNRRRARLPDAAAADLRPTRAGPTEFDALCEGTTEFNGFYGHGIVDAYAAVTGTKGPADGSTRDAR